MKLHYLSLICALGIVGCSDEQQILPTSPTTNTATSTVNVGVTVTFPTPTVTPTPGTSPGPSPTPPTEPLPLPAYVGTVVTQVSNSNPALLANSCVTQFGPSAWAFLDTIVDTLRTRDVRWGYVCTGADCANPVQDAISYRATSDPSVGIHIVDVIDAYCVAPVLNVRDLGYFPNGRYSTRNRF